MLLLLLVLLLLLLGGVRAPLHVWGGWMSRQGFAMHCT
jgi:hypothetical protein